MSDDAAPDTEVVAAVTDGAYTLLVADFASLDAAWEAYELLEELEDGRSGGVVLGVIFPPSIIGSAAVLGGAGATVGKVRELRNKGQLAKELGDAILPGHSGLLALVSDPEHLVSNRYGVGTNIVGDQRMTFLVDREGKIAKVWPDVDPGVHAEEVLAAVRAMP